MKNFNERFEKESEAFDREFDRIQKWTVVGAIIALTATFAALGFFVWVVVSLLQFFGVV